jgi:ubiquinone/menaquinone biosynthesis C-methylase UbiE
MSLTLDAAAVRREQAYFDNLVSAQGEFNPFADRGWQILARQFEKSVRPRWPLHLLDIGCGTGQSRQMYERHTKAYVGVDLSERAIATARARFPQSEWLTADARTLPFPDESFDAVAFSSVLHHIPDFPRALCEAGRVLKPGGAVFAFDPNLLNPAMALFRHPRSPVYLRQGVSPDERPLLPRVLRRAFCDAGLIDVGQRCLSGIAYRAVAPRLINACLTAFNVADKLWEWLGPGRYFGTFVITWGHKPIATGEGR